MKKRIFGRLALFFVIAPFFTACSFFSSNSASGKYTITGTIVDEEGNAVQGAQISVSETSLSAVSTSDGSYSITGLSRTSADLQCTLAGKLCVPSFENLNGSVNGSIVNIGQCAENGTVSEVNFVCVDADSVTIPYVQGELAESPLKGLTVTITGVVTMIQNQAPHWYYTNADADGSDIAQYVGSDGFYMEALPADRDFSGLKSNGIFVNTHNEEYSSSQWIDGVPSDLEAGDIVSVTGVVQECRLLDRYNSSAGNLTRTEIKATSASHVTKNGENLTSPYPMGVLITYSSTKAQNYKSENSYEYNGVTYEAESRVMPHDLDSSSPMKEAIKVLESMESMVIVIEEPQVVGATYYNLTGILADGAKDESDNYFRTFNSDWMGNVIQQNQNTGYQDYNEELLFVDYAPTDWKTYSSSLAQIGDTLLDSTGAKIFRGVLDYTCDGVYMAHPLNTKSKAYLAASEASTNLTPYYTNSTENTITNYKGETVPNQGWKFTNTNSWYMNLDSEAFSSVSKSSVTTYMTTQSSSNSDGITKWRAGTSATSFDASSIFTPAWKSLSSTSKGVLQDDWKSLRVAAFNIENYEAQGTTYDKVGDLALIIKNNLLYPDVLCVVEMGDDKDTGQIYENEDCAYAEKDGVVTAVRNFSTIIERITTNGGPKYEFRCIDPKEGDFGGKGGVNIRTGFLFNTERVEFVDSGLITNYYENTHDSSGNLLDETEWPVQTANNNAQGWALADATTSPYLGNDGKVHLSQSPSLVHSSYFSHSRRPLAGEFKIKDSSGNTTSENFFVVACHLASKRGDYPLYGSVQPPLLLSEVKRNGQAQAVNSFVESILKYDSQAKIVVAGDMNDFAYATPAKILTGEEGGLQILYSLTEEFMPATECFSYSYEGNLQQIDHVFVSSSLYQSAVTAVNENALSCTLGEEWKNVCFIAHINSMFTRNNHYNFSDHDPDMIRIPNVFSTD